ncbi:2-hydroxyacid dehydrogenase [Algisphaera agarilytica]|uniref:D-lactate dehydrogenase n=1 Tax=Algisphaera agarilytica TaxID=1385975 RepID=A0A7X0H7M9_9BACT|nr:2-hydroxyacid dehydrogenase [Algisphaera agarilytica]MBB6429621.1 D-lactate dehydrogenase [Algisphaera agarilytica]
MKIAFFNTKRYDRRFFDAANAQHGHDITYLDPRLEVNSAVIAAGHDAACLFVNDDGSAAVIEVLAEQGIKHLALRSAGFNHVDLKAAEQAVITVCRVPAYSPHGVAEHAIALMMTLNRMTHRAFNRVRESNFALEGLLGFEMHGRTAGVVGTGKIGAAAARILAGFGCRVLAYDVYENDELKALGVEYVTLDELFAQSEIITLHCPLMPETEHLINADTLAQMQDGVMLINTSRGKLIHTDSVIDALKTGRVGHLGLDVYEEEDELFFEDHSGDILQDDEFARLLTFPNVLITGHQAFFTRHALEEIASVTLTNLTQLERGKPCPNTLASW